MKTPYFNQSENPWTFTLWRSGKESAWQCWRCRRCGVDPWVRKIPWRRKWQLTLVFFPRKFHRQRRLVGYSPRGHKELDTVPEHVCRHTILCVLFLEKKSRSFGFLEKMIRSYRVWSLENEGQLRNVLIWEVAPLICASEFHFSRWYGQVTTLTIKADLSSSLAYLLLFSSTWSIQCILNFEKTILKHLFILFLGCVESSLLHWNFLWCSKLGLLSRCGARASHCSGLSRCGAWTLGRACGLSSCGTGHVESSWTRDGTHVLCVGRRIFNHWTTREAPVRYF